MTLATGAQLAARLETYRCRLHNGQIPRCVGQKITAALDTADNKLQRQAVILAILDVIDPNGSQSLWQLASSLESAIARLNGVPLRRIQSGHRPATPLEALLITLMELPGPRTQEKLFQELRKLALRSE